MTPYLSALLIALASFTIGGAICRLCGASAALVPATGLATVMALAWLGVVLPFDGFTAAVLVLVAVGVALWTLRRHGGVRGIDPAAVLAGAGVAAFVALQFLANSRLGIPGISLNNDTATHLLWIDALRSDAMHAYYPPDAGYPLGPHAVVAALADGAGIGPDHGLTGLLIATPALIAATAVAALRPSPLLLRAAGGGFVAATYLGMAWFVQGAFKEPLLVLFVLAFSVGLSAILRTATVPARLALVPLGLVCGGAVLTYGHLALVWLAGAAALALVLALIGRRPDVDLVGTARAVVTPVSIGLLALFAAVLTDLPRLASFASSQLAGPAPSGSKLLGGSDLGNLAGPLPFSEGLTFWPSPDFRFERLHDFFTADFKHLVAVALVASVAYLAVRRRDVGLVGGLGSALAIWVVSNDARSPYVAGKALAVLSPFVALVLMRALLPERLPTRALRSAGLFVVRVGLAAIIVGIGIWSSELVLRGAPVESSAQRDDLQALRPLVASGPTLFLGADDYAGFRLRDVPVAYLGPARPSPIAVTTRPGKPFVPGQALDWDSFDAPTLDRFKFVVIPRSPYTSAAPPNFRLLRRNAVYEAWERTGPTLARGSIEPQDAPAARLPCSRGKPDKRLAARASTAVVLPHAPRVLMNEPLPPIPLGGAGLVGVTLPPGEWQIGLKYASPMPVRVQLGARRLFTAPPNVGRTGPWWQAGTLTSDGKPQQLVLIAERESRFAASGIPAEIDGIVAVRPGAEKTVSLRDACNRYVDYYTP